MTTGSNTSTTDTTYNLISIVYHALQAVDTYHKYMQDATESGDSELSQILQTAVDAQQELANKAKDLLTGRLSGSSGS
jgi:hypothetical protein